LLLRQVGLCLFPPHLVRTCNTLTAGVRAIFQRPARRAPKVDTITNDYTSHQTIGKVWRRWILIWWQWQ
jgi:hypothetical protein